MTENEPSMDEILNSIHSILAEGEAEVDETEVPQPQAPQPAVKEQAPQPPKVAREPIPTVRPSFSVRDEAPAEQAPYAPAAEESQELTEESSEGYDRFPSAGNDYAPKRGRFARRRTA